MIPTALSRPLLGVLAFALLLPMAGCFEALDNTYQGVPQVEINQVSGSYTATVNEGATASTFTLRVNLIGSHRNADLPMTFTVVPENTTAVEGTHYSFPNGREYVIPAGTSFGQIPIQILPNSLALNVTRTLRIRLESNDGAPVLAAPNLSTFTLTIRGT